MLCIPQYSSQKCELHCECWEKCNFYVLVIHRQTVAVWIPINSMPSGFRLMQDVEQRALHSEHDAELRCLMMILVSAAWEI